MIKYGYFRWYKGEEEKKAEYMKDMEKRGITFFDIYEDYNIAPTDEKVGLNRIFEMARESKESAEIYVPNIARLAFSIKEFKELRNLMKEKGISLVIGEEGNVTDGFNGKAWDLFLDVMERTIKGYKEIKETNKEKIISEEIVEMQKSVRLLYGRIEELKLEVENQEIKGKAEEPKKVNKIEHKEIEEKAKVIADEAKQALEKVKNKTEESKKENESVKDNVKVTKEEIEIVKDKIEVPKNELSKKVVKMSKDEINDELEEIEGSKDEINVIENEEDKMIEETKSEVKHKAPPRTILMEEIPDSWKVAAETGEIKAEIDDMLSMVEITEKKQECTDDEAERVRKVKESNEMGRLMDLEQALYSEKLEEVQGNSDENVDYSKLLKEAREEAQILKDALTEVKVEDKVKVEDSNDNIAKQKNDNDCIYVELGKSVEEIEKQQKYIEIIENASLTEAEKKVLMNYIFTNIPVDDLYGKGKTGISKIRMYALIDELGIPRRGKL